MQELEESEVYRMVDVYGNGGTRLGRYPLPMEDLDPTARVFYVVTDIGSLPVISNGRGAYRLQNLSDLHRLIHHEPFKFKH